MRLDIQKAEIKDLAERLRRRRMEPHEVRNELLRNYGKEAVDRAFPEIAARREALPKQPSTSKRPTNKVKQWRQRWRAVDAEELPPITRLVLWEISEGMDWNTGDNAYASMQTIATGTGLNMKTLRTHRDLAIALGWLRMYPYMKRHGKGWAYALNYPTDDKQELAAKIVRKALAPKPKARP